VLVLGGSGDTQEDVSEPLPPRECQGITCQGITRYCKAKKEKSAVRRYLVSQGTDRACALPLVHSSSCGRTAQPLDTPHREGWLWGRVSWEISGKKNITSSKLDSPFRQDRDSESVHFRHLGSGLKSIPGRTKGEEYFC